MAEWPELIQSLVIGVIFSFLLAKLFNIIFAFRDQNLQITRADDDPNEATESKTSEIEPEIAGSKSRVLEEEESLIAEKTKQVKEKTGLLDSTGGDDYGSDSDSDWEGVESTELDEAFSAATAFVAATAADKASQKVSNEVQLQLYALYKIATEGPCSAPQPSALKMTARAKWQAWQKLGAMPPEEAMEKYIEIVTELYPTWAAGSAIKKQGRDSSGTSSAESKGPMGPVFSTFIYEDEPGNELKLDALHAFAREGDMENLIKCIESGVPVNVKDSEGRTPLHWAVDRGHLDITKLLINRNSEVNVQDIDGQTPLHYAAVCEREEIAEFLVNHNADLGIKDNEGNSPGDLCELNWPWIKPAASAFTNDLFGPTNS